MRFQDWVAQLAATGHRVCGASTAVPVDLLGLLPDDTGFHLRCRGTRVVLSLYTADRAGWQVRVVDPAWTPEEALAMWERRPYTRWEDAPPHARLVFEDNTRPNVRVVYDGARELGWSGYEAGLLRPAGAAVLFERLLAEALPLPAAA